MYVASDYRRCMGILRVLFHCGSRNMLSTIRSIATPGGCRTSTSLISQSSSAPPAINSGTYRRLHRKGSPPLSQRTSSRISVFHQGSLITSRKLELVSESLAIAVSNVRSPLSALALALRFICPPSAFPLPLLWSGPYSGTGKHQSVECYHGRARYNHLRSIPLAKMTFVLTSALSKPRSSLTLRWL